MLAATHIWIYELFAASVLAGIFLVAFRYWHKQRKSDTPGD